MRPLETSKNPPPRPKPRKRIRKYVKYANASERLLMRALRGFSVLLVAYAVFRLIGYGSEYHRSRQESSLLLADYQQGAAASTPMPLMHTAVPTTTACPTAEVTLTPTQSPVPPELAALSTLPPATYPNNPYRLISDSFRKLRRRNEDIIGWLHIEDMLDEAVVQRDNQYYLRRDYFGYHNQNGALFLDEHCDLRSRPYEYILYGHNMKSGAMFGSLRNYEKLAFFKEHALIRFDTMYEEGMYVAFCVSTIHTEAAFPDYAPIALLPYSTIADRVACIQLLQRLSQVHTDIDVTETDQLLFLVTCDGDSLERRIVAARRLRDNEDAETMKAVINRSYPQ